MTLETVLGKSNQSTKCFFFVVVVENVLVKSLLAHVIFKELKYMLQGMLQYFINRKRKSAADLVELD